MHPVNQMELKQRPKYLLYGLYFSVPMQSRHFRWLNPHFWKRRKAENCLQNSRGNYGFYYNHNIIYILKRHRHIQSAHSLHCRLNTAT